MELVTQQAMKAGFYGGIVVDYPNSSKAKKIFLVLMTGANMAMPEALGTDDVNSRYLFYSFVRYINYIFVQLWRMLGEKT